MIEKCYSELSYISKIDKKTFEVSAGWVQWLIIAKYTYYESYEGSVRDARSHLKNW